LLDELGRHTPKIVLLLTKADLLSEPQRREILAFVRKQILRKWQIELPIFFYSVRPEEHELTLKLEQKLLLPLVENRAAAASQIAQHKLLSLLAQTLNYLRVAFAAATQEESARSALHDKLAEEGRHFDLLRAELGVLSRQWWAEDEGMQLAFAEVDAMTKELKGLYINDRALTNIWQDPPLLPAQTNSSAMPK
jgi:hypothetical protein